MTSAVVSDLFLEFTKATTMPAVPDIHFGMVEEKEFDWRESSLLDNTPDDDEELSKTPQDVVSLLGFDPLEEDLEKQGSGVMIGFFLPSDLAKEVALDRDFGEKPEELHLTVLYLGKELTEAEVGAVKKLVERCGRRYAPLQGTVGGVARFPATPSSDNKDVLVRLVDVPRLELLREHLIRKLRDNGIEPVLNHGYTPHITLAYVEPEFESTLKTLKELPLAVNQLTVAVGGLRFDYPLNGEEVLKAMPTASDVHVDAPIASRRNKREYSQDYLNAMLAKVKKELPEWMYKELVKIARSSAGGHAKARYRRETMEDLGKEFVGKAADLESSVDIDLEFNVVEKKADKKQVFGWALVAEVGKGAPVVDRQGDVVNEDEMERFAYNFVSDSRQMGVMHKSLGGGKLIESFVATREKQEAMGVDFGKSAWWIGWQIEDDEVWKRIKDGELTSFSIHGKGKRLKIAGKE